MRLTIERGSDPILKSSCYSLKIGTRVYHYEKLADILYRIAVIFEPPQEEEKPKKKYTKQSKRFPLGDAILKSLPNTDPGIPMGRVIEKTGTPNPYGMSIWGAVMSKLVKKGLVKVNAYEGEKVYRRAK